MSKKIYKNLSIIPNRVCVGIQVAPDDTDDWYCRLCIKKQQESHGSSEKKKKRKKKDKKEH